MTLPAIGQQISMSQVNVELNVASTTQISLNDTSVRGLAGKAAGVSIGMNELQGKSAAAFASNTISATTTQQTINISTLAGYVAGRTTATITVNSGVTIYSTSTSTPALTISGATTGDSIVLINNGVIMGKGGDGGSSPAQAGGPALSISANISITNNGYIVGGGGAGYGMGGGGAGGGKAGDASTTVFGGAGGALGATGGNGSNYYAGTLNYPPYLVTRISTGGGGGRIIPGQGGLGADALVNGTQVPGTGGGAGGGGASKHVQDSTGVQFYARGGAGGSGSNKGGAGTFVSGAAGGTGAGGGGGWGAAGGDGSTASYPGGSGGAAVLRNGYTITWAASGTVYGSY